MSDKADLYSKHLIATLYLGESTECNSIHPISALRVFNYQEILIEIEILKKLDVDKIIIHPYMSDDDNLFLDRLKQIKDKFSQIKIFVQISFSSIDALHHQHALSLGKIGIHLLIGKSDLKEISLIRKTLDQHKLNQIDIAATALKFSERYNVNGINQLPDDSYDAENYVSTARDCFTMGANYISIQPTLFNLDIIKDIKNKIDIPTITLQSITDFCILKKSSTDTHINEKQLFLSVYKAQKRAGTAFISLYNAREVAEWLAEDDQMSAIGLNNNSAVSDGDTETEVKIQIDLNDDKDLPQLPSENPHTLFNSSEPIITNNEETHPSQDEINKQSEELQNMLNQDAMKEEAIKTEEQIIFNSQVLNNKIILDSQNEKKSLISPTDKKL